MIMLPGLLYSCLICIFDDFLACPVDDSAERVPLVEQELLTFPEHLSSPLVFFIGVRVTLSLFFLVCFVDSCLSFYTFSFDNTNSVVICPSSMYSPDEVLSART
jgi:hypothetical protein